MILGKVGPIAGHEEHERQPYQGTCIFHFLLLHNIKEARRRKDSDDEGIKHGQQHNLSWADTEGFNANQFRNHDHEHDTDMQFDVLHGSSSLK